MTIIDLYQTGNRQREKGKTSSKGLKVRNQTQDGHIRTIASAYGATCFPHRTMLPSPGFRVILIHWWIVGIFVRCQIIRFLIRRLLYPSCKFLHFIHSMSVSVIADSLRALWDFKKLWRLAIFYSKQTSKALLLWLYYTQGGNFQWQLLVLDFIWGYYTERG